MEVAYASKPAPLSDYKAVLTTVDQGALPPVELKRYPRYAASESVLNTDMAHAYVEPGKRFLAHLSVEHAKELVGPNGENTNLGEEFARRHKRAERGMYLNIEKKYMLDYGAESAWRSDTCRLGTGGQLEHLMALALRNGHSRFWRGFTRGPHREVEFIAGEGAVPAPASGPKKGQNPNSQLNGRPPR